MKWLALCYFMILALSSAVRMLGLTRQPFGPLDRLKYLFTFLMELALIIWVVRI